MPSFALTLCESGLVSTRSAVSYQAAGLVEWSMQTRCNRAVVFVGVDWPNLDLWREKAALAFVLLYQC